MRSAVMALAEALRAIKLSVAAGDDLPMSQAREVETAAFQKVGLQGSGERIVIHDAYPCRFRLYNRSGEAQPMFMR
jgi:hypothetical protein